MSTRANIVIKDSNGDKLIFYKHSDGYERHTMPILNTFLDKVKSGEIRDNVGQAAAWLLLIAREEYLKDNESLKALFPNSSMRSDWKFGYIEPTTCIHGDIEYLYTINLKTKKITVKEV